MTIALSAIPWRGQWFFTKCTMLGDKALRVDFFSSRRLVPGSSRIRWTHVISPATIRSKKWLKQSSIAPRSFTVVCTSRIIPIPPGLVDHPIVTGCVGERSNRRFHLHEKGEIPRVAPSRKQRAGRSFNTSQRTLLRTAVIYERAVVEVTSDSRNRRALLFS